MRTILVVGAGGPASTGFIRSLSKMKNPPWVVGADYDPYALARSEADRNFIVPPASQPKAYIAALNEIIVSEKVRFIHAQSDIEVAVLSANRDALKAKYFLPDDDVVSHCHDKFRSWHTWNSDPQVPVPDARVVFTVDELRQFMNKHEEVWIRLRWGAAGAGSLKCPTFAEASNHLKRHGPGTLMIAEYLSDKTAVWQAIYEDGFLVIAQGRARHGWAFSSRAQSGVTGLTSVGETISDSRLDRISQAAIHAIDPKPHGIYGVDCCMNKVGEWTPTEINIGRFNTTHDFFTKCGWNFPEIYLQVAFGIYKGKYRLVNKCKPGMLWIRGIDTKPTFISKETL